MIRSFLTTVFLGGAIFSIGQAAAIESAAFAGKNADQRIDIRNKEIKALNKANLADEVRKKNANTASKYIATAEDEKNLVKKCEYIKTAQTYINSVKTPKKSPFDGRGNAFLKRLANERSKVEKGVGIKCAGLLAIAAFVEEDVGVTDDTQ